MCIKELKEAGFASGLMHIGACYWSADNDGRQGWWDSAVLVVGGPSGMDRVGFWREGEGLG